jgi:hypothetical protein
LYKYLQGVGITLTPCNPNNRKVENMSKLSELLHTIIDRVKTLPKIHVGTETPTDDSSVLWLNPDGEDLDDFLSELYFKPGDSVTFRFWTAGTITNQGKHVHFALPFDRPLIGVDSITISEVKAQIRQNDTYLLGNATSEGWATPDLCRVMLKNTQGLQNYPVVCTIEFNTAPEGVINNDAVGISFEGVVTFE